MRKVVVAAIASLAGVAACVSLSDLAGPDADAGAGNDASLTDPDAPVATTDAAGDGSGGSQDAGADSADASDACVCASGHCSNGGCEPVVFVTSMTFSGEISDGGVVGADQRCTQIAKDAGLEGTYQAWLCTTGAPAPVDRFTAKSTRAYRRLDGKIVAANFASLAQPLQNAITVTEQRTNIGGVQVWSGCFASGDRYPNTSYCNGWTSGDVAVNGGVGDSDQTSSWSISGTQACSNQHHVYCFEQQP